MKILVLVPFLLLLCLTSFSQNYYFISFEGTGVYENDLSGHELFIDFGSNPNNIWQIGEPQKNMFTSAVTLPNAIVTDTLNHYPNNDTSSFVIKHVANAGFSMPYQVSFSGQYYVHSDTLTDYGLIEFSPDNGVTWIDLINDPTYFPYIIWTDSKPVLSGNSTGWTEFQADLSDLGPHLGVQGGDTVQWRFTFISDSIQTNKDGLMFDNLSIWDVPPIGIEEIGDQDNELIIFPNPATDAININLHTKEKVNSTINLYSNSGVLLDEFPVNSITTKIDLTNYPIGQYYVIVLDENETLYHFGSFVKE